MAIDVRDHHGVAIVRVAVDFEFCVLALGHCGELVEIAQKVVATC